MQKKKKERKRKGQSIHSMPGDTPFSFLPTERPGGPSSLPKPPKPPDYLPDPASTLITKETKIQIQIFISIHRYNVMRPS